MKLQIKSWHLLLLIFFITFAFRLYFTFGTEHFSSGEAYFNLRYVNHLLENKSLMFYDDLSYGGRLLIYPPLFYVFMSLFSLGSVVMLKILPELFLSSIVFIIYFMAKDVNGNEYASLFAALLSGFIPIFLKDTLNVISPYSLALPILLLMLYSSLRLENKFYMWAFILSSFLLPLVHPIAIVFVITILVYFLLLSGGALVPTKLKKEAFLFSILAILLISFIIYKKAFFEYGINIIGQNIPLNVLADQYQPLSVSGLLIGVGILPLVLGCVGIYLGIINQKKKPVYFYSAFTLGVLILLSLRMITISVGMMILGIALCIFSALTMGSLIEYIKKTRFANLNYFIAFLLLVSFVAFSFIPSYTFLSNFTSINEEKINDIKKMAAFVDNNEVILGNLEEGHLISAIANRKNFIDTNFLLAPNPVKRLKDVEVFYTTFSEAKILELLKKYNIKVIYFSEDTKQFYFVRHLKYTKDNKCFRQEGNFYVVEC